MVLYLCQKQDNPEEEQEADLSCDQASGNWSEQVSSNKENCVWTWAVAVQRPRETHRTDERCKQDSEPNDPRPIGAEEPRQNYEPQSPRRATIHQWTAGGVAGRPLQCFHVLD